MEGKKELRLREVGKEGVHHSSGRDCGKKGYIRTLEWNFEGAKKGKKHIL